MFFYRCHSYGGLYVPFDEFRLPTFLTSSDFSDQLRLFDDFSDDFLDGGKLLITLFKEQSTLNSMHCILF